LNDIFAGGIGNKWDDPEWTGEPASTATLGLTTPFTDPTQLKDKGIHIPEWTWKIILALQPGQGIEDVTINTPLIAVMTPNEAEPYQFYLEGGKTAEVLHPLHPDFPDNFITQAEWRNWENWQVSVDRIEEETGLDFFSELPDDIENPLEAQVIDIPDLFPQSSLLAEPETNNTLPIVIGVDNSSVFQNQSPNRSASKINRLDIFSSTGISSKVSFSDLGIEQVSPSHLSSIEFSTIQTSRGQISSTQIGIGEITPIQSSTSQIGIGQIGISQICSSQDSLSQISTTEINPTQISSKFGTQFVISTKIEVGIDSTNINSSEIETAKISLPGSIPSSQFFSVHNFNSQITDKIDYTILDLWNNHLNPQIPIEITYQITDLPAGQLAEATITGFNAEGKPNQGTIFIDRNANGIGWFIDETTLENSEFGIQNSEMFFEYNYLLNKAKRLFFR
jgi:hypothetical protein